MRVQIDTQYACAALMQPGDESGSCGCFADAAFLIGYSNDLCQRNFLLTEKTMELPLIFILHYVDKKR